MIAEPPLFPGALKVIVASPLPAVAVPTVGASGAVADPETAVNDWFADDESEPKFTLMWK